MIRRLTSRREKPYGLKKADRKKNCHYNAKYPVVNVYTELLQFIRLWSNAKNVLMLLLRKMSRTKCREDSPILPPKAGVSNLFMISYYLGTRYCQRVSLLLEQLI